MSAGIAAACTSNPAPDHWLPSARETPTSTHGAWIVVRLGPERADLKLGGELLAVDPDTLFVLARDGLTAFPATEVREIRVAWYESGSGPLMLWSIFGTLGTLSHGFVAGLTMPIWIITGTLATGAQMRAPIEDSAPGELGWSQLNRFARFPQGIPSGLDRELLEPRSDSRTR